MTKTIVALYDDFATAERVIDNLLEAGFAREDLSVMANDASGEYGSRLSRDHDMVIDGDVSAGEGAGFGAVVGTLIGVGVSLIPGIGPVIGAGPLAVALTAGIGAAAGAITGGVTAGLIDMGVDEEDAHIYAEGVRRGGTLVSLTTNEEWAERAEHIMNRYHPVDIDTRSSLWRERGWSTFDRNAQPYSASEIEQERLAYRDYNVDRGMGSMQEEDLYSNEERRASIPTTGRASGNAASISDNPTRGGNWASEQFGRGQTDHAEKMSGAIPHSQVGATSSSDVAAGATPPGSERHHETSHAVDKAMNRDASGTEDDDTLHGSDTGYPNRRTGGKQDTNPLDTNNLNR